MMRFDNLSIRAKLAIILGLTIFTLAATRALGLGQLGSFLDRFAAYTTSLESLNGAQEAVGAAERALLRREPPAAVEALARLERLAAVTGLAPDPVSDLKARIETAAGTEGPSTGAIQAELADLGRILSGRFADAKSVALAARAEERRIMNATYVSMLLLVLGAGCIAFVLIARMIARPLERMMQVADTVAAGDLRSEIDTSRGDELGRVLRALANMNEGLSGLIGRVRNSSGAIHGESGTIDSASAGLAQQIARQAAALERTAATMQLLTAAVDKNAEHSRRAADRAQSASALADKGDEEVTRVVAAMGDISDAARQITEISDVINAMAMQTNIIALNAAVEAARAGEPGRGFAVVAAEVRSLAQKSAVSAQEVRLLIEGALERVEQGVGAVRAAGTTLSEMVAAAKDVREIVADIARLSGEQADGLRGISAALSQVEKGTRESSDAVASAARSARSMREEAAVLRDAVAIFRLADEPVVARSAA